MRLINYYSHIETKEQEPVEEMFDETHKNQPNVDGPPDVESELNILQQANANLKPGADPKNNIKNEEKLNNIITNTTKDSGAIKK